MHASHLAELLNLKAWKSQMANKINMIFKVITNLNGKELESWFAPRVDYV